MKSPIVITAALAFGVAAPLASAHNAGDIIVRAGAAMVSPQEDSSQLKLEGARIGGEATVNSNTQLGLTLGYMLTEHVGIELLAASPFKHRIGIKGSPAGIDALNGKLGDVKQLPPTLSLQYFPLAPTSRWQPYVGAGVNYTAFFDEKLTRSRKDMGFSDFRLSDSWGLALQIGSDFMITDRLMLNAAVWYIDIDTTASARLAGAKVKADVEVDPWVFMVGLGYKF